MEGNKDISGNIVVEKTVTILGSPEELYPFWRNLENLPLIMDHLESIRIIDAKLSRWVAKGPVGKKIEWTAQVMEDIPNQVLTWKSVEGSDIITSASVQFRKAPGDRGTEVKLMIRYDPPGGTVGAAVLKLLGDDPANEIREGLRHFKQLMETGEIITTEGQPSGRAEDRKRTRESDKAA